MRFANPQAARVCVRGCKGRRPERDQRGRSGGTLFRIETIILTRNHRPLQKTAAGLRRGWKSTSWRWDRGKVLEVEFRHFLRPELKFDSLDTLKQQMHADAVNARRLLDS